MDLALTSGGSVVSRKGAEGCIDPVDAGERRQVMAWRKVSKQAGPLAGKPGAARPESSGWLASSSR
jgi:hypothetical protein